MAESLCIVAPAYNEAANLEAFCAEWLPVIRSRGILLLVDDGSSDGSGALLDRLATTHTGIQVLHQPHRGHGAAIVAGYHQALDAGADWIFQVDSDRQFDPADFEKLWSARHDSAFVLGVRAARHDRPLRIVLSATHRTMLNLLFGTRLRDPNAPYRLLRASLLRELLASIPDGVFAPNVFLALAACRRGCTPCEVSVSHLARSAGTTSIHWWKTLRIGWRCGIELWRFRFQKES
ncbi:MAG: glycosyltransferase family 2 protein [Bryobacteraceae bacterium]|jgi:glycosyltransferase involved in cell wall biosynthesis